MNDRDCIIRDLKNLRDDFKAAPDEESQALAETLDDAIVLLKGQPKIDFNKCGDCKWLKMAKKRKVGNMCVNPNIKHTGMGHIKYKSSRACKRGFEQK